MTKILTEHQISVCEKLLFQKLNSEAAKETLQELIVSHRSLLSANAELSFNNMTAKAKVKEYYLGLKGSVGKSGLTEMDVYHATQAIENVLHAFNIKIEGVNA